MIQEVVHKECILIKKPKYGSLLSRTHVEHLSSHGYLLTRTTAGACDEFNHIRSFLGKLPTSHIASYSFSTYITLTLFFIYHLYQEMIV